MHDFVRLERSRVNGGLVLVRPYEEQSWLDFIHPVHRLSKGVLVLVLPV